MANQGQLAQGGFQKKEMFMYSMGLYELGSQTYITRLLKISGRNQSIIQLKAFNCENDRIEQVK